MWELQQLKNKPDPQDQSEMRQNLWELLQVRDFTDRFLNCGNSYKK
ncbi:hypothetical protein LEP1GSC021_2236 [Leptospira noguchii str. 1993005606]|nr:hypothetical protein LEP1GSC021_2236 [Leptospira noguchii str. 1993005606]